MRLRFDRLEDKPVDLFEARRFFDLAASECKSAHHRTHSLPVRHKVRPHRHIPTARPCKLSTTRASPLHSTGITLITLPSLIRNGATRRSLSRYAKGKSDTAQKTDFMCSVVFVLRKMHCAYVSWRCRLRTISTEHFACDDTAWETEPSQTLVR